MNIKWWSVWFYMFVKLIVYESVFPLKWRGFIMYKYPFILSGIFHLFRLKIFYKTIKMQVFVWNECKSFGEYMDILINKIMGMAFPQLFVRRNNISTALGKKLWLRTSVHNFFPLSSGNIISSHKKLWKCPIPNVEISIY